MAAVQTSQVNNIAPFYQGGGVPLVKDQETLLTDGSRTVPLAQYTLMSKIAASGKWVPFLLANVGASDGSQYPAGILAADGGVTAAALAAGDVTNTPIYVGGGIKIDGTQLVFDKGSTGVATAAALTTVLTTPTGIAMTCESFMQLHDFYVQVTVTEDLAEN